MVTLSVRPFQPPDRQALATLAATAWPGIEEDGDMLLAKCRSGLMLVLTAGDRVRGYGAAFPWQGELPQFSEREPTGEGPAWWHLHDITVDPALQRRGAGRLILDALISEGTTRGFQHLRAVAVSTGGVALLRSRGFVPSGTAPPGCYGPAAIVMARTAAS